MQTFLRPVTVVVPIYNAARELEVLLACLQKLYPLPTRNLSFVFSDDASTQSEIGIALEQDFFSRMDVSLWRSEKNLGFVRHFNLIVERMRITNPADDIILLNTDTKIFNRVFESLQDAAYSGNKIATVTPLTNNGTLASLINFPLGGDFPQCISPDVTARLVLENPTKPRLLEVPTGVGFCLYMKREALKSVGPFDEAFGRGYGEETDWCCRAAKLGWAHVIDSHSFVQHVGACSFGTDEWKSRVQNVSDEINRRHPTYETDVGKFIDRDPLKYRRLTVLLEALAETRDLAGINLFALHANPQAKTAGGTERYSKTLSRMLAKENFGTIDMFPGEANSIRISVHYQKETVIEFSVEPENLGDLLFVLRPFVRFLHVQHLLGWSDSAIETLKKFDFDAKTISLHDLYFGCPSYNMIASNRRFCNVETDETICARCFPFVKGKSSSPNISAHRDFSRDLLKYFDVIHSPSTTAVTCLEKALGKLPSPPKILPHDLSELFALESNPSVVPTARSVAFLGELKICKGREFIIQACGALRERGIELSMIGGYPEPWATRLGIETFCYDGPQELSQIFANKPPAFALIPSIWPETFSFTFYEALILSHGTIPIVSPLGHPAEVVKHSGAGILLKDWTAEALVAAIEQGEADRNTILERKRRLVTELKMTQKDYFTEYSKFWSTGRRRAIARLSSEKLIHTTNFEQVSPEAPSLASSLAVKEQAHLDSFLLEMSKKRTERLVEQATGLNLRND